jgi:hypothetical protein
VVFFVMAAMDDVDFFPGLQDHGRGIIRKGRSNPRTKNGKMRCESKVTVTPNEGDYYSVASKWGVTQVMEERIGGKGVFCHWFSR